MSRSTTPARRRPHRPLTAGAVVAVTVLALLGGGPAATAAPPAGAQPVVTRAALDPALVAGRGADVDFVEQEAENARTNGEIIGPDRSAYTLPAEASGRRAVRLTPAGTSSSSCPARRTRSPCGTASRTRHRAAGSPPRWASRSTAGTSAA